MTDSTSPGFGEIDCHMPKPPTEVIFYQTQVCNFECAWCRRTLQGATGIPDVSRDLAGRALEAFPEAQNVCIAGFGEPLLSPSVGEVIDTCLAMGRRVSLITNGSQLENLAKLVPTYQQLASVNVSLNAATAEEHQAVTGRALVFQRIVRQMAELAAKMPRRVTASFVINAQNFLRIPQYLGVMSKLDGVNVAFVNQLPHASPEHTWQDFLSSVLTEDTPGFLSALPEFRKEAQALGVSVSCWPTPISAFCNPRKCRSPWQVVGIDGAGWTFGCRRVIPPRPEVGGNLNSVGARAWNAPHFIALRRALRGLTELPRPCGACFGNWQG